MMHISFYGENLTDTPGPLLVQENGNPHYIGSPLLVRVNGNPHYIEIIL